MAIKQFSMEREMLEVAILYIQREKLLEHAIKIVDRMLKRSISK